jgi:hypothetical protein
LKIETYRHRQDGFNHDFAFESFALECPEIWQSHVHIDRFEVCRVVIVTTHSHLFRLTCCDVLHATAERRWAMTGTPSKETSLQAGVRSLLSLFKYLKLEPFGGSGDKKAVARADVTWEKSSVKAMAKGQADDLLIKVLSHVMIRHTKDETVELPKVIRMPPTCLTMSLSEETSYNAIVSTVRTNIVMTSMYVSFIFTFSSRFSSRFVSLSLALS